MNLELVVFDWDATLVDSKMKIAGCFERAIEASCRVHHRAGLLEFQPLAIIDAIAELAGRLIELKNLRESDRV